MSQDGPSLGMVLWCYGAIFMGCGIYILQFSDQSSLQIEKKSLEGNTKKPFNLQDCGDLTTTWLLPNHQATFSTKYRHSLISSVLISAIFYLLLYNYLLYSSPLVLLVTSIYAVFASAVFASAVFAPAFFGGCPHISSVNQGMPVHTKLNGRQQKVFCRDFLA